MMDSPRFHASLAKALEKKGGVSLMVMSHIDDVGDHQRQALRSFPQVLPVCPQPRPPSAKPLLESVHLVHSNLLRIPEPYASEQSMEHLVYAWCLDARCRSPIIFSHTSTFEYASIRADFFHA